MTNIFTKSSVIRIIGSADGPTSIVVARDGLPLRQIIFIAAVVALAIFLVVAIIRNKK